MAHGYTMVTGRPQVVMVHVIVGTANALGGMINAARANVPMLFTAGRKPITEAGCSGSRDRHIHWAQESFDQGGMVREFVKWDYELRSARPARDGGGPRAGHRRSPSRRGPVYLTLPREVLAERHDDHRVRRSARARRRPRASVADPAADRARRRAMLAAARNPIIIAKALGRDPGGGGAAGGARRGARRRRSSTSATPT